jgi:hypothetical protein
LIRNTLLGLCLAASLANAAAAEWPHIRPFDRSYSFGRPQDMYLRLPLFSATGKQAYVLQCASPEGASTHSAEFHPVHQFECRLSPEGSDGQLLARPSKAGPESDRSGFTWNQLNVNCYRHPEYGGERTFLLRNLRLIITISNVRLGPESRVGGRSYPHALQSFSVRLQGFYDPAAAGEFPVAGRYDPPRPLAPAEPAGLLDCRNPVPRSSAGTR